MINFMMRNVYAAFPATESLLLPRYGLLIGRCEFARSAYEVLPRIPRRSRSVHRHLQGGTRKASSPVFPDRRRKELGLYRIIRRRSFVGSGSHESDQLNYIAGFRNRPSWKIRS